MITVIWIYCCKIMTKTMHIYTVKLHWISPSDTFLQFASFSFVRFWPSFSIPFRCKYKFKGNHSCIKFPVYLLFVNVTHTYTNAHKLPSVLSLRESRANTNTWRTKRIPEQLKVNASVRLWHNHIIICCTGNENSS